MKDDVKIGVFLCQCGGKISDRVNLAKVCNPHPKKIGAHHVSIHPYLCLTPGLEELTRVVRRKKLNRVLLGACSERIMKKKFHTALKPLGFIEPQVDFVNLKDHLAAVHEDAPAELTRKATALLAGGVASLRLLEPYEPARVDFPGPVLILGGGISGFAAARELAHKGMESLLFTEAKDPREILANIPRTYPGSRLYFKELEALIQEVWASPLVKMTPDRPVEYIVGHVGDFRLGLQEAGGVSEVAGSAVILALDREFIPGEEAYIGGGERVMDQLELEERLAQERITPGKVVFWVNGRQSGRLAQELSAVAAWRNSQALVKEYPQVSPAVLYPADIRMPLSGADRKEARRQGIGLYTYDPEIHPVVQSGFLTYVSPQDHLEHELEWDSLVVSAVPGQPVPKAQELMRYLPIFSENRGSLKTGHVRLKPEQGPVEWLFLTGSAQKPCFLDEALHQGKKAARGVLLLREKAKDGGLASPTVVVAVDKDLCEGCGLCREICSCGGVKNVLPGPGPAIREVDPHTCDGGGSCAAACPYEAMRVLNNSTQQLEARIRAVLPRMREDEVLGFVCSWGGQGAADLAGVQGLSYSRRVYLLPVNCLGAIDPTILSMAFLNGANGILLAGCPPTASCHYGYGVDHTWYRVYLMKKLLAMSGIDRKRISIGYVDVNQAEGFVRMVESFLEELDRVGPMDRSEDKKKRLLAAHATLHRPRVRWVLGVSLRRPTEPEFPGDQRNAVDFDETMQDVLKEEYLAARIIGALTAGPMNPPEIAKALGERPDQVSPVLLELAKDDRIIRHGWQGGYPIYGLARLA